ncbi:DUF6036 family nucleotidyltransferase [Acetivibrio ethanolgignens]|nr:DUF6036 family nucleotidyltransferase [Acetivibrio ethanolgignens]
MEYNLRDLSRELKNEFGRKANFELIIVGGAAIALRYGFRETTQDIDAILSAGASSIKDAVRRVSDKNKIDPNWLNSDFVKTRSYSKALIEHSKFYKTYNQVLQVRIIEDAFLVAMKLKSFRVYKNDMSDIVGVIQESPNISIDKIKDACLKLYGSTAEISDAAWSFVSDVISGKIDYCNVKDEEVGNRELLLEFEKDYDKVLHEGNLNDVLEQLKKKRTNLTIMDSFKQ